ncbi:MAG: ORF6N domain-containing protein [Planctomycetes bacterium]|nr:ORF6N domain-containing protein [Planctomycetota bacterium]
MAKRSSIPVERIEQRILYLRGEKVLLDADLAGLYGVETRVLVQAVTRRKERFPADFMFRLSKVEFDALRSQSATSSSGRGERAVGNLRSQSVTSSSKWGGRRYPPYAFTELGVAMLSSVLNSERAVAVNIEIMRAFVRLRRMLASHEDLARKLAAIEKRYDGQFKVVFDALHELMNPPAPKKGRIGFRRQSQK